MDWRRYSPDTDRDALLRIWHEIGWFQRDVPAHGDAVAAMTASGNAWCALINGTPECIVTTAPGTLNYLGEAIPISGVSSVCTSHIGRKQNFARDLSAIAIALDAANGALVSALTMFEQGFYNRLGYGNGPYEHRLSFDPARLNVSSHVPTPRRIGLDELDKIHRARMNRHTGHGALSFHQPGMTLSPAGRCPNGFGLGYNGEDGEISHMIWLGADSMTFGPYVVHFMTWQTPHQLMELLGLIKQFGDQVRLVTMMEPAGIQLQDFLLRPIQQLRTTHGSGFEARIDALSLYQYRICDLQGCLARTHLHCTPFRLNLKLTDPIDACLDFDQAWRGIAGDYVITIGPECSAHRGEDPALLQIECGVGAFTRLWLGARAASSLYLTDALAGHDEAIERLDLAFRLPTPQPDWDF
ncbi:MAG: GNAT family N-acetyltransferase [Candidatus Hydrogenedentes bacterium]|nr:GNAT family N-acetyltransferase [Candidatus Hydrogenedentota bacterium]